MTKVLVVGAGGYVGSTVTSALIEKGVEAVLFSKQDNHRKDFLESKNSYEGDMDDRLIISKIFAENEGITHAIICSEGAALEQENIDSFEYYEEYLYKASILIKNLIENGCSKIVFTSTGGFYKEVEDFMVTENSAIEPRTPFAKSKYILELLLKDFCKHYGIKCISLRCFSAIGADPVGRSGLLETNPKNIFTKLYEASVYNEVFKIYGDNWGTRDGTCIRDYIHIWDIAQAHIKAVENFDSAFEKNGDDNNFIAVNIGTGIGTTVKECISAFKAATKLEVETKVVNHHKLEDTCYFANPNLANYLLDWRSQTTLEMAMVDGRNWIEGK